MNARALRNQIFDKGTLLELDKCSACGNCHCVCPVYNLTGDDTLSARGRIHILRALYEGTLRESKLGAGIFNRCLLCYACETVCPSGVQTSKIWIKAREYFARSWGSGLKRTALRVVSREQALPKILTFARTAQKIIPAKKFHRGKFRPLLSERFLLEELPSVIPAKGIPKYRVGYFVGCVSNFFLNDIGKSAIEILSRLRCEVVIPHEQVCCGAPAFNNGEMEAARKLARKNMEVFLKAKVDIITSADSTCGGSFTHEYAQLLPDEPGFAEFSSKFREIHSLILELSVDGNLRELPAKVTYHDSCHLRHTQGVWKEPRQLLRSLAGIDMREMKDSDLCCGFGGFFSLFHGLDSCRVSEEKLDNVLGTGAEELICGSPGCILKLRTEAATRGLPIKVKHTVEFIAERMINK